jgi:hypothetical protein
VQRDSAILHAEMDALEKGHGSRSAGSGSTSSRTRPASR